MASSGSSPPLVPSSTEIENSEMDMLLPPSNQQMPQDLTVDNTADNQRGLKVVIAGWWRSMIPCSKLCSLSNLAFFGFLETVATAAVMSIMTLNIYSASYFLAWAKPDSICLVGTDKKFSDNVKVAMKIITVGLPFTFCPVTLYISGHVKALQTEGRGVGYAAGLVIFEIVSVFLLGAMMTVCMSEATVGHVIVMTSVIVVLVLLLWGCLFHHPKCLRRLIFSCDQCCPEMDVEAAMPRVEEN